MHPRRTASLALAAALALGCAGGRDNTAPPSYAYAPMGPAPAPMGAPPAQWAPLPAPWQSPVTPSGPSAAVAFAQSRLGAPYCWGGVGPGCYDCSGLTHSAWLAGGKAIPRTSAQQAEALASVPLDQALPGDILWRPGHVALYVGQGWAVGAPGKGEVVRYQPAGGFVRALRP